MNKSKNLERYNFYLNRAFSNAEAVHTKAVKNCGIDFGTTGDSFEVSWKLALGLLVKVAGQGRADGRKYNQSIEFKSGAGELAKLTTKGWKYFTAKDWVFYSPDYEPGDNVAEATFILSREDFFNALEACGLIRKKKSSYAMANGLDYDRLTIQSYKNSRKKYGEWLNALSEASLTYEEWLEEVGR